MISVCMATYNGAKYINKQVDSILKQLSEEDELLISDDGSIDNTVEILKKYNDPRIKIFYGGFHSPVYNFENVIRRARGEYIFLSDQDDIWKRGRIQKAIECHIENNCTLVLANAELIDPADHIIRTSFFQGDPIHKNLLRNLYKNPYLGCCISFRKELLPYILPFPEKLAMHDIWIGLVAQRFFKCCYIGAEPLVQYRRHGINFTAKHKYSIWMKFLYRYRILKHLFLNKK